MTAKYRIAWGSTAKDMYDRTWQDRAWQDRAGQDGIG